LSEQIVFVWISCGHIYWWKVCDYCLKCSEYVQRRKN